MDEGFDIPTDYLVPKERKNRDRIKEIEENIKLKKDQKELKKNQKELEKQAKEQNREPTDLEFADDFLKQKEGEILYDKRVKIGYIYKRQTRLWNQFENFDSLNEHILEGLQMIVQTKSLKNVIYLVKSKLMNREDNVLIFNTIPGLLPMQDAVFDMKTQKARERVKEDYFSFTLKETYNPKYDKQWVHTYIGSLICKEGEYDHELVLQVLELIGYSFTGENNLKKILLFKGGGDNGKSLLLEMIKTMMTEFVKPANKKIYKKPRFENNTHEAHLMMMIGARIATVPELDEKDEFYCESLKSFSGNDEISIRNCGSDKTLNIIIKAVLIIACNEVSKFQDRVLENRLSCIPFVNKFERNAEKADEIRSHINDLFSACLDGANRYYTNKKDIVILEKIKQYTRSIADSKDSFIQFIEEETYHKGTDKEYCKNIYYTYMNFCKVSDMCPDGKEMFYKKIETMFDIKKIKDKTGNYYLISTV